MPPGKRALEREKLRHLSQSKTYLISLMKYLPYQAEPPLVRLADGSVLKGTIPYCNEKEVSVRLAGPGKGLKTLRWSELDFKQFVAFFDFYMQKRLNQGTGTTTGHSSKYRQEAGEDCMRLALLCDWYGYPDLAQEYANLAREHAPSCGQQLSRLLPSAPKGP